MKKFAVVLAAAVAMMMALPAAAQAQDRPDGFGVGVGQATGVSGISGKVHSGDTALQGVLGSWRRRSQALGFSGDLLFNQDILLDEGAVQVAWNIGFGGTVGISAARYTRSLEAQIQGVAGLELLFPDVPVDLVFEFRPSLRVIPLDFFGTNWGLTWGGAHLRIYL